MAFKLTREEATEFNDLKNAATKRFEEVTAAVDEYKEKELDLRKPIDEALTSYNEALGDLRRFVENVSEDRRSEFDDKSENWQEGDNGQAADEWITSWEEAELDEVSISYPDDLTIDFENGGDIDLPAEV